jgi:hypothetical protein
MRYKKLFICMLLLTLQNHAIDLNDSNQIIEEASFVTVEIQNEMETIISQEPIIINEENLTYIENNITKENNDSIPSPTIKSVLEIEENLTAEVNTTIEETNTTVLNKETFDMSAGSLEKGEEIYKKELKEVCETQKSELSEHYSQDEWEAFASEGKFENAIFEICPQIEPSYNKAWSEDLYQFYYQNARDSEAIPEF